MAAIQSFLSSLPTNLSDTLFTQCLSSVGVLNPSPLKTWPRWPPQLLQTISVRTMPPDLSSKSANGAGDRLVKSWPSTTTIKLCIWLVKRGIAGSTIIDTSAWKVVVLAAAGALGALLAKNSVLFGGELYTPLKLGLGDGVGLICVVVGHSEGRCM